MQPENLRPALNVHSLITFFARIIVGLFVAALTVPFLKPVSAFTCNEAVNVALAARGATATASSSASGFAASGAINGDRKGLFAWQDGYWSTAAAGSAWLEVQFNGSKTISEIDVITTQNNYNAPVEPTEAMTFSSYGQTAFEVQYWTGSTWATISGGSVTANNKVWRRFTFAAITTTKIKVLANASPDGFGRITEIEAWTGPSPAPRYNLALGATATASSTAASGYGPNGVVNGDRKSLNWGNGGGWADAAPANSFPDWLQVDFATSKTIGEIDVFTLQDTYAAPVEPTESTTFTQWGVTAYEVQYWDGSAWLTVTGGNITGNNKVWRKFTFVPVSTTKIRVYTHAASDGYSRLTEVEAYEPDSSGCVTNSRLDPLNETGGGSENPLSRNFNWNLPFVGLPGRAGLDVNLALSYNSLVWTRNGNSISFDDDRGFPGPGFRLGFPVIQPLYYNAEVGAYGHLLIASDGSRTELRQVGTTTLYEAADSSHLLLDASAMVLRGTDGTQWKYELKNSEFQCTEIKDRNGNYITVNYTASGRVDTIVDTLARSIKFNYDATGYLTSITQIWNQGPNQVTHNWAAFEYTNTSIQSDFTGLTVSGPANGSAIKTLSKVTLPDGSHYDFSYTSWGQVWKVSAFAADNHLLNYRSYKLPGSPLQTTGPQTDCPRFTERRDWAENWNQNVSGLEQEAITSYTEPVAATWTMPDNTSKSGMRAEVTSPDGTLNKNYFIGTVGTNSGWQRGLPALVETYSGGSLQRQVVTTWTQDNPSVSYTQNPRVTETNVYDPAGNRARVKITYQQATFANGTSCWLPRDVYEYAADATSILRSTRTDYHTSSLYTDRRIVGLVTERRLYEGDVNNGGVLMSKIGFFYDNENSGTSIQGNDAPVQHDNTNYSASFVTGRANLSSVRRYNVADTTQFTTTKTKYNTAGAVVSTSDAANHTLQISYTDSFSDAVSRNTLAYPTKLTDPDGYFSTSRYNYDFGALTYRQTPPPNFSGAPAAQPTGPEQSITYDQYGRLQQVTNEVNDAYTRYVYPISQTRVDTYTTIQEGLGEAHSFNLTDGAGRVIATATQHPGSTGGYSGQKFVYDLMGRLIKTSNPTETYAVGAPSQWATAGDDQSAGWIYKQQTYDWKGRPLVTTNQDGTTQTASYSVCGCAGGEVVTLTDEGTLDAGVTKHRQQKIYSDVLGRSVKTEVFNWQGGAVYSATVTTYNARDQVTQIRQYNGAEGSPTFQDTTFTYDAYGRLRTRHVPQQQVDPNISLSTDHTTWDYNPEDTIQKITDARGASQTLSYNARRLVTGITYSAPTGITPTGPVSFAYDAARNRIWMTDDNGRADYSYDQLSQMLSETRQFNGLAGSYALSYEYNLGGELKSITDPTNATIYYGYDAIGRVTNVTGSPYAGVSQYASALSYRAWGSLKGFTYGNNFTRSVSYNSRLKMTQFDVAGRPPQFGSSTVMKTQYQYYADGALKYADDLLDDRFDRAFGYDSASRLNEAYSGSEAHGFINQTSSGTTTGSYRQSYTYDAWSNPTSRTGRFWSKPTTFTASYSNGRNTSSVWEYDADGRVVREAALKYIYDAAGRNVTTTSLLLNSFTGGRVTQSRDGDGLELMRVETRQGITAITHHVRSTVLDGKVVTELTSTGQKQKSYVYVNGERLAEQEGNFVVWKHTNPLTGSESSSYASGQYAAEKEPDTMLVDLGFDDPYLNFEEPTPGSLQLLGGNSNGQCTVAGMSWDCMSANRMRELGVAEEVVPITVFAIYRDGTTRAIWNGPVATTDLLGDESSFPANQVNGTGSNGHAPDSGFAVLAGTSDSIVTVIAGASYAWTSPQNTSPIQNLRGNLQKLLDSKDCAHAVQTLLDTAAGMFPKWKDQNSKTFMEAFDRIASQGGYVVSMPVGLGHYGGTVDGDAFASLDPRHGAKPAVAYLHPFNYFGSLTQTINTQAQRYYSYNALHETFHLAARGGYSDEDMAKVVSKITGWSLPGQGSSQETFSEFWDKYLANHCRPKSWRQIR